VGGLIKLGRFYGVFRAVSRVLAYEHLTCPSHELGLFCLLRFVHSAVSDRQNLIDIFPRLVLADENEPQVRAVGHRRRDDALQLGPRKKAYDSRIQFTFRG
jgi:hypothetical protein